MSFPTANPGSTLVYLDRKPLGGTTLGLIDASAEEEAKAKALEAAWLTAKLDRSAYLGAVPPYLDQLPLTAEDEAKLKDLEYARLRAEDEAKVEILKVLPQVKAARVRTAEEDSRHKAEETRVKALLEARRDVEREAERIASEYARLNAEEEDKLKEVEKDRLNVAERIRLTEKRAIEDIRLEYEEKIKQVTLEYSQRKAAEEKELKTLLDVPLDAPYPGFRFLAPSPPEVAPINGGAERDKLWWQSYAAYGLNYEDRIWREANFR